MAFLSVISLHMLNEKVMGLVYRNAISHVYQYIIKTGYRCQCLPFVSMGVGGGEGSDI